jgi:N-sulfoglucosamine sulfohydrolase
MRSLPWLLALLALLLAGPPAARAADKARRNVVLLVADDLGLQVGCYGDPKARTPNLDALAKNGTRFRHAFAAVSSCSPSRATLYTGLHTHTSGQYGLAHAGHNFHTRPGVKSLPAVLNAAGYYTGIIGKVHVVPRAVYPFGVEVAAGLGGNRNVVAMAAAARKFFADAGDRPFLLVVGFADPHRAARGFANDKSFPGVKAVRFGPSDVTLPYFLPDKPDARQDLADYYQAVTRLDQGVGLVLKALQDAGRGGDTLVIFLSDNGIPFPGAKTTLYDSGIHLPLLVSSPAQRRRGLVNQAMVSWVDVMPTILDWAQVKAPPGLAGRSFLPVLEEENPRGWGAVFGSHQFHEVTMYYPMRMLRTRTHKYLLNLAHPLDYPFASDLYNSATWQGVRKRGDKMMGQRSVAQFVRRPREELYDLEKDPNELKNVAGDAKYAAVLAELRKRVKEWQEKTGDPWTIKDTHE